MGTVRCQHGILSIPVPATANIMEAYQLPIEIMHVQGEFVTPTGAAIVAALKTDTRLPGQFCIKKIGLGAGKRTYQRPSILRAMLIEACDVTDDTENDTERDAICKLELMTVAEKSLAIPWKGCLQQVLEMYIICLFS